jgi:hypothetical protein
MHCGVMVTGYNQDDWERLLKGEYDRPPTVSDAQNMDDTLAMGELDVHFISLLPVKQLSACTAWGDTRPAQIVGAES